MPETDTILIEADTVESALSRLTDEFGPGAQIVSAERVRRGGIAGFFATEGVELVAIPPKRLSEPTPTSLAEPAAASETSTSEPPAAAGRPIVSTAPAGMSREPAATAEVPAQGVESAFARLLEVAESGDTRPTDAPISPSRITPQEQAPPATSAAPTVTAPVAPTVTASIAAAMTAPALPPARGRAWNVSTLIQAGLPARLVSRLAGLEPADDVAHIATLAHCLEEVTGSIGVGTHRLIGARAARIADAVGLEVGDGPVHLVLDDSDDEFTTTRPPQVISWVDESAAPRAIALAFQTGAVLGWGMPSTFGAPATRLTPVDAALAVRNLLEDK